MLSNALLLWGFSGADAKIQKQCFDFAATSGLRVGLSIKLLVLKIIEQNKNGSAASRRVSPVLSTVQLTVPVQVGIQNFVFQAV